MNNEPYEDDDDYELAHESIRLSRTHVKMMNGVTYATLEKDYHSRALIDIEKLVKHISSTNGCAFQRGKSSANQNKWFEGEFSVYYPTLNSLLDSYDENYFYNSYINLFHSKSIEILGQDEEFPTDPFYQPQGGGLTGADLFNQLIEEIRTTSNNKAFKEKLQSQRYNLNRNERSAIEYVNALFLRYSRLLTIRIDFHLQGCTKDPIAKLTEIKAYFERFLNNRRSNSAFNSVVGHIWKLEHGEIAGPHYHVIFFLDGSKAHKDGFLGMKMGEYWLRITNSRGRFFNGNANKEFYKTRNLLGIGMISHHDVTMRRNLERIVKYFFKPEQYLSAKYLKKMRTFGRGMPPQKRTSSGRPRLEPTAE